MHQDLVKREDLPAEDRRKASFELAEDYFKAGLLDHAEEVLDEAGRGRSDAGVHRNLLDIYIQEKDWAKAIDAAKKLEVSAKRNYQKEIANYYCELAITEQIHGRKDGPTPTWTARSNRTASASARTCCAASGARATPTMPAPSRPGRRSRSRTRRTWALPPKAWSRASRRSGS
jgi:lipopolysaccharide biosynthesis regulator YciM